MTKWVEAKAITKATEHVVSDFLFEEVFARYGTSREIISDGGAQFTSHMILKLMEKYGIKHRIKTPYHPHVNTQVESTIKYWKTFSLRLWQIITRIGLKNSLKIFGCIEQHGRTRQDFHHLNLFMGNPHYF